MFSRVTLHANELPPRIAALVYPVRPLLAFGPVARGVFARSLAALDSIPCRGRRAACAARFREGDLVPARANFSLSSGLTTFCDL